MVAGDFADVPPRTAHDWNNQIRVEDTRLDKPWFNQLLGNGDDSGGLTREPWNEPAPKSPEVPNPSLEMSLLDDDFGNATANTDPLARATAQRAYGVHDEGGDDALPVF